jgi:mannitol-specific phosphotransferase system IIBC component
VPGATFRYTVLRLGIFVVCLVVARAAGAVGWLALLIAAVVSVLLSLVLLRRQREQMAAALQQRVESRIEARQRGTARRSRFKRGLDEDNAAED